MPTKVHDWISKPVVVVDAESSVSYAITLTRRSNIYSQVVIIDATGNSFSINFRHRHVAGESEAITGLISAIDIFRAAEEIGWGRGS